MPQDVAYGDWQPTPEQREAVRELQDRWGLTLIESLVIYLHYGLGSTLAAVGEYLGLSRVRLRAIDRAAKRRLLANGFDADALTIPKRPRVHYVDPHYLEWLAGKRLKPGRDARSSQGNGVPYA